MRVSVVINSRAGTANEAALRSQIEEALFRCDLRFSSPKTREDLESFAKAELGNTDFFMICGGDGTVNWTLNVLLRVSGDGAIPPVCLIRSGTANDLANHLRVHVKIKKAARSILEGKIKKVDLIEIESDRGDKTVMVTNGGLGIPAMIARDSNRLRAFVSGLSRGERNWPLRLLARSSEKTLKRLGPGVYLVTAVEALRKWSNRDWEVELSIPGEETFVTKASSILISNQPRVGRSLISAPFTSNTDGLMNVLVTDARTTVSQARAIMALLSGTPHELDINQSFEIPEFSIRSRGSRPLDFFGDGELLVQDARELRLRCHPRRLAVVVGESGDPCATG